MINVDDVKEIIAKIVPEETGESKLEQINYYDNILRNIESIFTSIYYDTSKIDSGKDEIIITDKMTITFTTTLNQKNNINKNLISINLGECEDLLRNFYNLSKNETLYMKIMSITQDGMKTKKVEYDVYCKLKGANLIKLNLTVCSNSKISILLPFEITKNIDEYNTSSGYYNDICYVTTSEEGTDITLKDRKTNYFEDDKIVCQEGCYFSKYDFINLIANCSCNAKESPPSFADMAINKEKLLYNFRDIKNFLNFNFLFCYKKLFNKKGILNNYGCYLITIIILFHILDIFVFYIKQFSSIKMKIKYISYGINKNIKSDTHKSIKNIKSKNRYKNNKNFKNYILTGKSDKKTMITSRLITKKILNKTNKGKKIIKKNIRIKNSNINNNRKNKSKEIKDVMEFIDEEINILPYNLALKYDKRNYCNYYISLLKTKHNLLFSFLNNDYNSRIVKIDLFIIGFAIDYMLNALFYNDDTMHKIYESKGQFDLEVQIPIITYSFLLSMLFHMPLDYLALPNDDIITFKQNKSKIDLIKRTKYLIKIISIKSFLYFIISFLLLVFIWYYISMFGVIYRNTQIHLLKDTSMSFGLSLIIPFFLYIIPGFFRIPALSNIKNKKECLYNISKALQWF